MNGESADLERDEEPLDLQPEQQEVPIEDMDDDEDEPNSVFIDIALGNQKHRITLTPESDAAAIAQEFASRHGLDQKLMRKLQEQLEQNIESNF